MRRAQRNEKFARKLSPPVCSDPQTAEGWSALPFLDMNFKQLDEGVHELGPTEQEH